MRQGGKSMIENKGLLIAVTALALVGVLGLFAYSATLEPLSLEIGEIGQQHAGTIVSSRGTVTQARSVAGGAVSLTLCDFDTSSSIGVFYSSDKDEPLPNGIVPGAFVSVKGEVRLYQESPELYVTKAGDIALISMANGTEYGLDTVMESIQMFDGLNITTAGSIADLEAISSENGLAGTAFSLVGESDNRTYSLECFCYGRDLTILYDEWDAVRVTGRISYYTAGGCWQMDAEVVSPQGA